MTESTLLLGPDFSNKRSMTTGDLAWMRCG
jgi:hypothetical protein